MAIEPIGTATAIQVQQAVKVQKEDKNKKQSDMDIASEQTLTPKVDELTEKIAKASEGNAEQKKDEKQKNAEQESLKKAVEEINKNMVNTEAVFGIHEGTNRVTIKIVDKDSKKLIKELPPEKTLDMIARVWEMAGILVDERR